MNSSPFAQQGGELVQRVGSLRDALERGDERLFQVELRALAERVDAGAMQRLKLITEDLNAALGRFRVEARLDALANKDVPDARHRLEHVLRMTDAAAHRTLDLIEQACPLAERTAARAAGLTRQYKDGSRPQWLELSGFLAETSADASRVREQLSEVLVAQGYQDLTGQIIRGVLALVDDVEVALTRLISLSDGSPPQSMSESGAIAAPGVASGFGPPVPQVEYGPLVDGQSDVDALLLEYGR